MFTNCSRFHHPNEYDGVRYMRSNAGLDEDTQEISWNHHAICMDGETDEEDVCQGQVFESEFHWIHLPN